MSVVTDRWKTSDFAKVTRRRKRDKIKDEIKDDVGERVGVKTD